MPPPLGEAVLFELRALPSLPNCLLNYVTLLPSGWVVHFWHSSSNAAMIHNSSALQPALASGRLVLTPLKDIVPWAYEQSCRQGMITLNRDLHNHLVASTDLWRALSAPSVLLFQCDAALCPNPSRRASSGLTPTLTLTLTLTLPLPLSLSLTLTLTLTLTRSLDSFTHLTFVGASWKEGDGRLTLPLTLTLTPTLAPTPTLVPTPTPNQANAAIAACPCGIGAS